MLEMNSDSPQKAQKAQKSSKRLLCLLCFFLVGVFFSACCSPASESDFKLAAQTEATPAEEISDDKLQQVAAKALGEREGTVLVIDPQTGRLRAVVNPRLAFEQAYPPGSAIKPFTALAALKAGLLEAETRRQCQTKYAREGFEIVCSHPRSNAPFNLTQALAYSCNDYFAHVGERLSEGSFNAALSGFGFGQRTGVAAAEAEGKLPRGDWRVQSALGDDDQFLVTPVQLLMAFAALVNGGELFRPQQTSDEAFTPTKLGRINISAAHRKILLEGMRGAVRYGTAEKAELGKLPGFVFGKTGTSTASNGFRTQGWFVGFAADKPAASQGLLPVPDYSGELMTRNRVTGDWGGTRTELANKGVQFDVTFTQVLQSVVDGGLNSTTRYSGSLDYVLTLDLMRMGVMPGAMVKFRGESRFGNSVNDDSGSILPVNTDAFFPLTSPLEEDIAITITNLTYYQFLSEQFGVVVGKIDTLDADPNEFASGRGVNQFMNANLVIPSSPLIVLPAYSTLGWFSDPVLNTFISYSEINLARLIFHELAHQVVYVPGDTVFNESFATAVEQEGIKRWFAHNGTVLQQSALSARRERETIFTDLVFKYRKHLQDLFQSDLSEVEKRAHKARIFDELRTEFADLKTGDPELSLYDSWISQPLNNALLATVSIYSQLVPAFQTILAQNDQDMNKFFDAVTKISKLPKEERNSVLQKASEDQRQWTIVER